MIITTEVAILDACVLFPPRMRDLLLYLAKYNVYDPRWTAEILHERERTLKRRRKDLSNAQIESVTFAMNEAFPDALVAVDPLLTKHLKLPDMDDVHVLAGAISCGASTIVTANLKDFPKIVLSKYSIRAKHPDAFCARLIRHDPLTALQAFTEQVAALKRPSISAVKVLEGLARSEMRETASLLTGLLEYH